MDIDEFSNLVNMHGKAVYGFCYRLAGNKADADDLYQETFLKAMEMLHKLDANHNPKSFLISIAIRLRKNHRRKWARRQRIMPSVELKEGVDKFYGGEEAGKPEEAALSGELSRIIRAAADNLNDRLRIPLYLYYTADMSVVEIAEMLKIPKGTVKSRLFLARKAMKKQLEVESDEGIRGVGPSAKKCSGFREGAGRDSEPSHHP
ncbi:RNA polymerase sigma-70 factor, ECF subfamily [Paenibacillus uliginis N3/975]|uniref:RNA polymerase sigma-70 factor, ECF subfamily n=1 Tax=Paenibacillus uliginis N3/975 TaxID=1313296 RepID=A0A1X7HLT7_9BACL|nr:RNA polymerase sigma factor [Paenibacillus uliginis]SMF89076.1 RNA polymerase sigma-70 factor, ECF subfamily [Paenibacillus uliginis N3/975]